MKVNHRGVLTGPAIRPLHPPSLPLKDALGGRGTLSGPFLASTEDADIRCSGNSTKLVTVIKILTLECAENIQFHKLVRVHLMEIINPSIIGS